MLSKASWSTLGERHVAFCHRRSSYIAWVVCVTLVGLLLLAPPSLAANDRVVYVDNFTLWTADSQGGSREQVTESGGGNRVNSDDLSPDGQTAVVARPRSSVHRG
jgi:Tol biopolymer transport system component